VVQYNILHSFTIGYDQQHPFECFMVAVVHT